MQPPRPGQKRQADWNRDAHAPTPTDVLPEKKAVTPSTEKPFSSSREAQLESSNKDRSNPFASLSSSSSTTAASPTTFSFSFGGKKDDAATTDTAAAAPATKFNFSFGKPADASATADTATGWADKKTPTADGEPKKFAFSFGSTTGGSTVAASTSSTNFFQSAVKASADLADEKNKAMAASAAAPDVVVDADVNIATLAKVQNQFAAAPVVEKTEEDGTTTLLSITGCKALRFEKERKEWVEKGVGPFIVAYKEIDGSKKYRGTMHSQFTKSLVLHIPMDKTFGVKGCNGASITMYVAELDEATNAMKPALYCVKCPCEADATKLSETLTSLVAKIKA